MDFRWSATAAIVGASVVLILLERIIPYDKRQRFLRDGLWNDLVFYSLIQNFILGIVISYLIEWIDRSGIFVRFRLVMEWPIGVQFMFFFITHDLYIYWFHRWQHHSKWLWRLHEAHHSTKQVDWLSGSRSHGLEILVNQTIEFAPLLWLGAAPEVAVLKGTVDAIWGMYIHSNIDVRSGWLQLIINGPEMHRWHHSLGHEGAHNRNFATKLALWDWIFRTAFLPRNQKPDAYGISDPFPRGYVAQLLYAFKKFGRP